MVISLKKILSILLIILLICSVKSDKKVDEVKATEGEEV